MVETAKHAATMNDARILSDPRVRSAMNFNDTNKQLLPVLRKLLRLYLTLPRTSTSENLHIEKFGYLYKQRRAGSILKVDASTHTTLRNYR